jgi:hypothetical protein
MKKIVNELLSYEIIANVINTKWKYPKGCNHKWKIHEWKKSKMKTS